MAVQIDTILGSAKPADTLPVKKKLPEKKKLARKLKELYEKRRDYVNRWIEIRDYQLPFIGEFDETGDKLTPARRKDLKIAQGVAWLAAQVFAAGVMSGLTPPSRQWFRFAFKRPDLNGNVEAMKVLDQRQEIVSYILAKSNFYNSVHSVYLELPFGQCPLAIFYDPQNGVRFQAMTIGTYALGVDGYGKVDTVARKYEMTLQQIINCFGVDALPKNLQEQVKAGVGLDKKHQVNWLVEPNDNRLPGYVDKLNMPYRSVYWLDKSQEDEFLYVGGFEEWAIPVARYLVNGLEPYGKGPGWFAEGDSKMLQLLKKDYLTAVELSIKPPMKGPAQLMNNGGINLIPGGLTAVDDQSQQYVTPLFDVKLDLAHAQQEIIRIEDAIKRAYSADLFLMLDSLDNGRMTAREVMERTQEKLQQLGPVVERLQDEFLNPVIHRVYSIIERSGGFPPIPQELLEVIGDEDIEVDYISPLAQAQKMSGLVNIEQGIAQVAQMAQLWPEVLKKIDPLATISKYFEMLGAPAVMQRSNEAVAEILAQEQKAMQEQQEMANTMAMAQAAAPLADAAKNMTDAANDANPALTSWLGVPGGWE
ncbi:MAG: head-tail connector protein [Phascolarctobacterium sp.]|nr:head-tail connector protein [Phascolarctobacterium sp.]